MTEQEIRMGIRVDALKYIQLKGERQKGTNPEQISKQIDVPLNILVDCLKKIHVPRELHNNKAAQDSMPIYVVWDENKAIPRAYRENGNTQAFLNNPY